MEFIISRLLKHHAAKWLAPIAHIHRTDRKEIAVRLLWNPSRLASPFARLAESSKSSQLFNDPTDASNLTVPVHLSLHGTLAM